MTLWHASTELRLTTATAVVAKTVYLAARYTGQLEAGLGLGHSAKLIADQKAELTARLSAQSAELDTSG